MLRIGISRTDITPPVGIPLIGFAGRGPAIGIHDPLYATAMVASDGERSIAIVSCDLLYVPAALSTAVRQEVQSRTGIPAQSVAVSCTHTHYGPDTNTESTRPDVAAYLADLKYQLAGIVQEAAEAQQPARIGVGWGQSDIGVNRRERLPDGRIILGQNPQGPIDRALGVCRISDADGKPLGTIANFATHPVSQAGKMRFVSADYPGQARRVVELLTGAPLLFLQGACGNINAVRMEDCYEPARSLGTRLGCEIVRVWETITPAEAAGVGSATQTEQLPRYRYGSPAQAEALVAELTSEVERLRAECEDAGALHWAELRLQRAQAALASWQGGPPLEPISAEFQAYRLGDLAWATAPGEIFNELGRQVKGGSPFPATFFAGYTNGSIGYVPVPEAYPEGGYEVTHACQVDPEASQILVRTCSKLLAGLWAAKG